MKKLIFILVFLSFQASAGLEKVKSPKPLYEFGLIGGAGMVPDYPASRQSRFRALAAPIVRYRGLRFRSDEEDSMKARIFTNVLYGFDLSASGAFASNSSENDARKGMKDIDWVGELGPRFYIFLHKSEKLWVRFFFPVRGAVSSDLVRVKWQGLVVAPAINARYYFDDSKFNSLILAMTRTHTTHHLQEFYYQVDSKYATAQRPEYDAKSGYMGTSVGLALLREKENYGIYGAVGVTSYKGAANQGSPLHKADYNTILFFGVSYLFHQSEERGFQ